MLDTSTCSFIMCEQPEVVLKRLEQTALRNHCIMVSDISYAEIHFGVICLNASPNHLPLVEALCARLNATQS